MSTDPSEMATVIKRIAHDVAVEVASTHVEERAESAQQERRRTKNTIIILCIAVTIMVALGMATAIFLLVRSNDVQNVQDQIENRVTQTERAFCAFMIQRAAITITSSDRLLANQAEILIKRFGCENKQLGG